MTPEIKERHLAEWHRNQSKKSAKSGTAHAAVKESGDESEEESVASLDLEKYGMPTREELLKNMGYTNLNVSLGLLQE